MQIVAENHAESFRATRGLEGDAFLAAVIAESLRADLDEDAELPERFLVLARTLDRAEAQRD